MPHLPLFMQSPRWATIFWISFAAFVAHEVWVFSRDRRAVQGETRDRGSFQAIVVLQNLGFLGCFAIPYITSKGAIPVRPELLFYTAIGVLWIGLLFRFWSVTTLGRFFRTMVVVQDDHRLITTGPYRYLRNPSYTGGLLMLLGVGLAQGNAFSVLSIMTGGVLAYAWRVRAEELALRQKFGEAFDDYARRTWAVIPLVW
jgi:protein-S-isoprenylcysteine O-methyltransferase